MSSTATATQTRTGNTRGRGGNRGRRGRGGGNKAAASRDPAPSSKPDALASTEPEKQEPLSSSENVTKSVETESTAADDGAVCWICAELVKYWSLSECNHRTCHVCALRLRALYKKLECTFCKEPQPSVIFTTDPEAPWASYTPDKIPYKDAKLSISFETQEMMEETLILLRFNCPDPQCDFIGNGWGDLKLHTRATHGKLMCDICIRFKKVFAHEHALYEPNQLPLHLPSMARGHRHGHSKNPQQIEGGVHPLCEFCRECFFGDDELYAHMREKHEECFICKRNEVKDQYFRNYEALEEHFMHAHYPCRRGECLARKFVVFGSALDLKAHMVEEHGAEMSARDRRDARRVQAEFEFEEVPAGGGRRGRRDRGDREREREPPPHQAAAAPPGSGAGARPQAAGARRREAFSGALTSEASGQGPGAGASQHGSRRQSPSPDLGNEPRLAALVGRLRGFAPNAVPAVTAALRSYKANESSARDLISTVWNILDRNLDGAASIVNVLVDLVDDDEKKQNLLADWNGFKVEQRSQFPELVPTATGSEWSGVTSGRVINAKNSTAARSSTQSSRQLWDRVARAAASTSAQPSSSSAPARASAVSSFPPLQSSAAASSSATPFRQPQRLTPWASGGGASSAPAPAAPVVRAPTSVPGPGARARAGPPAALSRAAFPELPTASAPRVPKGAVRGNQSLRKILGESAPAQPAWQSGGGGGSNGRSSGESGASTPGEPVGAAAQGEGEGGANGQGVGGKKKGKGKQKQTLFTLGSFPT